ncbi:MAG: PAS domain S-box protein [Balneolaceae bacterium]|nr:PAS domain S-box protein [Balneolaceae bacterium]
MDSLRTIIKSSPFIIAVIYILVGALWIQYSDQLVLSLVEDPETLTLIQSLKGWFYVFASGILIFFLVYQSNDLIEDLVKNVEKSSKKFKSTFEYAPIGIAHHKPNENWILVNKSICNLLGYSKDELLNLDFEEFIHPDDLERGRDLDLRLIRGDISSYNTEKKYKRKNGTTFTGRVTKAAVYDKDKNPLYLIAMLEDISQQKENEIKLKQSLEEKQVLLSEVHHRVKNNVALMSALLELQLMHGKNEDTRQILEHYKTRLKTLSLIYEKFSEIENELTVNFSGVLLEQIDFLEEVFNDRNRVAEHNTNIDQIELNINQAIPVGLICNELFIITNQYMFTEVDKPTINTTLKQNNDIITFTVQNNGTLTNILFDLNDPQSLDSRIIAALTKQIEGEVSLEEKNNFNTYTLRFNKGTWRGAASYIQPGIS